MKLGFCVVLLVVALSLAPGNGGAAPTAEAVENWAYNHPDAAFELWSWAREHPAAARSFSQWEAMNHDRSKQFVAWAIAHPGAGIDAFAEDHPDWTGFGEVLGRHRSAAGTLLAWCRHYPAAARSLLKSSRRHRRQPTP